MWQHALLELNSKGGKIILLSLDKAAQKRKDLELSFAGR